MIEDAFVRDRALQAANIEIRLLPEYISAIGTLTEEHFIIVDHERNRVRRMLLGQTGRTDDQILRFEKTFFRVIGKQIDAALATDVLLPAFVMTVCRFVSTDSQPDQ